MFLHLLHQMPCVCTFSVSLWSKAMVKRTLEALLIPIATGIIKIFRDKIIYSYSLYSFYLFVSFKGKKSFSCPTLLTNVLTFNNGFWLSILGKRKERKSLHFEYLWNPEYQILGFIRLKKCLNDFFLSSLLKAH